MDFFSNSYMPALINHSFKLLMQIDKLKVEIYRIDNKGNTGQAGTIYGTIGLRIYSFYFLCAVCFCRETQNNTIYIWRRYFSARNYAARGDDFGLVTGSFWLSVFFYRGYKLHHSLFYWVQTDLSGHGFWVEIR